jgi:hypothetical protein
MRFEPDVGVDEIEAELQELERIRDLPTTACF